ncbi:hypothetical protein BDF19DRAFT_175880 [Syncephalis fuscata]|nr:hypothetical protein BDF19DRAFT_175880 [Syncephalis fuscata]
MAVLEELGNDNYSAATSSASKEELENTASAFLAISPSTTSNEVMEADPVTQLANVMEAAFAFPSEQAEADKQVTAAIAESAIFNAIVESNAPIEHKIVSEIVRKDDTPTEHKIVSELAMDMTSVTIIAEDKNASDLAVAPELLEATDVETLSKIEQITSTMAEEKSEITPDDINDHIDNDHLSITILDRTSKDFSLLLPPTPALAPSLSNNDDIAIDNNNNNDDDDDDKAIIDTDVASSLAMPATVDITIVEVKSTKKSRWFSKVGSKLIQKQDKSAKSTTHSLEVETKTTLTKEKTLRKSIRHRFRGVSRRDHVEPTDDAVHALDSHSFTTSADASSKTDAETTNSPSSSDDDADTTSNLDKAAHRSTKSLEVPRARRWARDIGAVIRRHHSDSFVGESALKKTTSESGPSSSASPPQLRIDTKMANQNANEEDSDRISSASSSSSSSLPITPTTPTHNPNDMHCPSRRVAYLGSVRKLQDGRRPLREMIGVQSVLAEVRRVGGVRVPVREVHAALAAGDRDMARRRRRLSARRQATVSTDGALMPLNGTRAAADVSVSTTNGAGQQHRRSSSWSQSPSLPTLRRLPSMPLAMPLISFDTPPIKSPSPLKLATPMLANLTGSVTVPATHDYEEDDVPLALLRESSGHRSSLSA